VECSIISEKKGWFEWNGHSITACEMSGHFLSWKASHPKKALVFTG